MYSAECKTLCIRGKLVFWRNALGSDPEPWLLIECVEYKKVFVVNSIVPYHLCLPLCLLDGAFQRHFARGELLANYVAC